MNGFYISKIVASGTNVEPAVIELKDGLNIITGPSNTGKSYVISCIDYIFGSKEFPIDENLGYTTITVELKVRDEGSVKITRNADEPRVHISSNVSKVSSGSKNIKSELGPLFLELIGIDKPIKIFMKQDGKKGNLTWRGMINMFLIKEEHIFRTDSILYGTKFPGVTSKVSSLLYLITGREIASVGEQEAKVIKEAKKTAVVNYIGSKMHEYTERQFHLEEIIGKLGIEQDGLDENVSGILNDISKTEKNIVMATDNAKQLMEKTYVLSGKIEEAYFLKERYEELETQYDSDIERLEFIIDGENVMTNAPDNHVCPYCENEIPEKSMTSYIDDSKGELEKTKEQKAALIDVRASLEDEILDMEDEYSKIQTRHTEIKELVDSELRPYLEKLKKAVNYVKEKAKVEKEIEIIREFTVGLNTDMQKKEGEDTSIEKINVKDEIDYDIIERLNEYLKEALEESEYPFFNSVHIDKGSFDLVVNGKKKRAEGKGYRAYLNTIFAFVLMKYLSLDGKYAPGLLILDSPILSLKENNEEDASEGMKASLFKYLVNNQRFGQMIIAENDIPRIDYKNANIIEFTHNKVEGRYGFLVD
ncbi:hypothetical protein M2149_000957 [Lachnospiraceae bacterium PFB1-21]